MEFNKVFFILNYYVILSINPNYPPKFPTQILSSYLNQEQSPYDDVKLEL